MKKEFEDKGMEVISYIDRPIVILRDKHHQYFIGTKSKLGQLIICELKDITDKADVASRFIDLEDDLQELDIKKL